MAMEGQGTKLNLIDELKCEHNLGMEVNYQFDGEDVEGMPLISGVTLYAQTILPTNMIAGLQSNLLIKQQSVPSKLQISLA